MLCMEIGHMSRAPLKSLCQAGRPPFLPSSGPRCVRGRGPFSPPSCLAAERKASMAVPSGRRAPEHLPCPFSNSLRAGRGRHRRSGHGEGLDGRRGRRAWGRREGTGSDWRGEEPIG